MWLSRKSASRSVSTSRLAMSRCLTDRRLRASARRCPVWSRSHVAGSTRERFGAGVCLPAGDTGYSSSADPGTYHWRWRCDFAGAGWRRLLFRLAVVSQILKEVVDVPDHQCTKDIVHKKSRMKPRNSTAVLVKKKKKKGWD